MCLFLTVCTFSLASILSCQPPPLFPLFVHLSLSHSVGETALSNSTHKVFTPFFPSFYSIWSRLSLREWVISPRGAEMSPSITYFHCPSTFFLRTIRPILYCSFPLVGRIVSSSLAMYWIHHDEVLLLRWCVADLILSLNLIMFCFYLEASYSLNHPNATAFLISLMASHFSLLWPCLPLSFHFSSNVTSPFLCSPSPLHSSIPERDTSLDFRNQLTFLTLSHEVSWLWYLFLSRNFHMPLSYLLCVSAVNNTIKALTCWLSYNYFQMTLQRLVGSARESIRYGSSFVK